MKNSVIGIVAVLAVVLGALLFGSRMKSPPSDNQARLRIVASFYPLAHFAEEIGKSYVQVTNITPAGAEPHEYEPTAKQIANAYSAKIVFANGNGLDPWIDRIRKDLQSRGVRVIAMSEYFQLDAADPHIWLDPVYAHREVEIIRDALIDADPAHTEEYRKNGDAYLRALAALDRAYQEGLAECALREIVTAHDAFGYLARRYRLNQISIAGISPEEEPSPARMAEIAALVRERNVKYIFFETLVSPKLADTIAREVGARTLVLNTVEGLTDDEIKEGKTYISVMEGNLANLRMALTCK